MNRLQDWEVSSLTSSVAGLGEAQVLARMSGRSEAMQALRSSLVQVAGLDSTVLLTGETGTGKGRAARALHDLSPRSEKPFVHVDCAALSPTLIESELFGHEKGAFTGAAAQRQGRFEWARDGTVFLDEIGDLEPRLQTKLLRVLDDRAFERLGGTQTLRLHARIVAATSHDLRESVRLRRFRADLYFRLGVFHFSLPPLRDRNVDLAGLVRDGLAAVSVRLGVVSPQPTDEFIERLGEYRWPGNVRELLNALERVAVAASGKLLRACDAEPLLEFEADSPGTASREGADAGEDWNLCDLLDDLSIEERNEIIAALEASRGSIAAAARRLHLPRSTLRHRMKKYGLGGR